MKPLRPAFVPWVLGLDPKVGRTLQEELLPALRWQLSVSRFNVEQELGQVCIRPFQGAP